MFYESKKKIIINFWDVTKKDGFLLILYFFNKKINKQHTKNVKRIKKKIDFSLNMYCRPRPQKMKPQDHTRSGLDSYTQLVCFDKPHGPMDQPYNFVYKIFNVLNWERGINPLYNKYKP